jgi:hypothetical protein
MRVTTFTPCDLYGAKMTLTTRLGSAHRLPPKWITSAEVITQML